MSRPGKYSLSEEDHLKAIYTIQHQSGEGAATNAIADRLGTKPSSVTVMIKRLANKGLVNYKPYRGVKLTTIGERIATGLVRKHRLWESFLVEHLKFKWHEVHDIAEQLEHIRSVELVDRLEEFMDYPKFDPHGDPIPSREGNLAKKEPSLPLSELPEGADAVICGLNDSSDPFLKFLDGMGFELGTRLHVIRKFELGNTIEVNTPIREGITLVQDISEKINVTPI